MLSDWVGASPLANNKAGEEAALDPNMVSSSSQKGQVILLVPLVGCYPSPGIGTVTGESFI